MSFARPAPKEPSDFEDRLKQFMQSSDSKLSELRYIEKKGGNRREAAAGKRDMTAAAYAAALIFHKRKRPVWGVQSHGKKDTVGKHIGRAVLTVTKYLKRVNGSLCRFLSVEENMLIINGTVHTMDGLTIPNGYVAVSGDKIAKVGPMEECPDHWEGETLDARQGHILPGFIDAHCHLGMFGDALGFEARRRERGYRPLYPPPPGHRRGQSAVPVF